MDWRLATLVPGAMDMKLPEGFGLPIKNGTLLDYFTMSLNQNQGTPEQTVRIKTRIDYAADKPMRSLFRRAIYVHQQYRQATGQQVVEDSQMHAGAQCGQSCPRNQLGKNPSYFLDLAGGQHPGASCCVDLASAGGIVQQFGADNTVHWMVPPGKHSFATDVSKQLELPYATTVHCAFGHLHPYGKGLRLVDKKTGQVVCEVKSEDYSDKLGVKHMSEVSSTQGLPLAKDGQYELVADYDNGTDHPIDAMAIMYLYLAESPDKSLVAGE